ncbi:ABC transporter efflux protein, DrrB family [Micromonospora auratinigra]|uniref:Transport permease protein n=1 Tax=Micromonospora auratinigra TaxID=261654 RepID=A0A1A9A4L6_9ACTN|nr:ABC transporter efflux protein, DrrB family [Micromonospora auratinigra]
MSSKSHSIVMLRRNFLHIARNPTSVFNAVLMPIVLMLMFVYMFGNAFSVGVDYIDYATPGLMLLAVCYGLGTTATAVNSDMTKGIINRFNFMRVSRGAVLTGHVVATVLTNLVAIAALLGVAFLLGFSPSAGLLDWLGAIGIILLLSFAASWLTVALGLSAKSPETAGLAAVPLIMLPFFSSAIVPAEKMGTGLRQFAEYQPFTPIIETLRGLLNGAPSTGTALTAIAWCVGIALVGYLWARPLIEEYYFRGFLLPRIAHLRWGGARAQHRPVLRVPLLVAVDRTAEDHLLVPGGLARLVQAGPSGADRDAPRHLPAHGHGGHPRPDPHVDLVRAQVARSAGAPFPCCSCRVDRTSGRRRSRRRLLARPSGRAVRIRSPTIPHRHTDEKVRVDAPPRRHIVERSLTRISEHGRCVREYGRAVNGTECDDPQLWTR